MAASQRIRYAEIRQVHQLVARLIEVGHDPAIWRPLAVEGLIHLVRGQVGLTIDIRFGQGGDIQMVDPIDIGWHTPSARTRYLKYLTSGELGTDPGTLAWLAVQKRTRQVTATRRDLLDDHTWYAAPAVSEARKSGDVDDFVMASVALNSHAAHGFIIYRSWSDKPFEARHRRLLKLFHLELARAARPRNAPAQPGLSLRLQQTLALLLTPLTLKEIAARLGLSRHTVNDYQKALYARFNVTSRLELIQLQRSQVPRPLRLPQGLFSA